MLGWMWTVIEKGVEGSGHGLIKELSRHLPGRIWGRPRKISVMIASICTEILNRNQSLDNCNVIYVAVYIDIKRS
jgi:hypothetical protein